MKTCKDFEHTGAPCCEGCHEGNDNYLDQIMIDGEAAYVCCGIAAFFYPDRNWTIIRAKK